MLGFSNSSHTAASGHLLHENMVIAAGRGLHSPPDHRLPLDLSLLNTNVMVKYNKYGSGKAGLNPCRRIISPSDIIFHYSPRMARGAKVTHSIEKNASFTDSDE